MKKYDKDFLRLSFELAEEALHNGNGAYGALIVDEKGNVIAKAGNSTSSDESAISHAEINAIQQAEMKRGKGALDGCTIYSSAEPCPMCAAAIVWSGLSKVVYGVSINSLISKGIDQIDVESRLIFNKSGKKIKVIGPLLENIGLELYS